jgi:hypothetical protein
LALLVAGVIAYGAARSITRPLKGLVSSLGPGANLLRGCVMQIANTSSKKTASPEETAIICDELNGHADDMIKAVNQLVSLVEGMDAARKRGQHSLAGTSQAA